MADKEYTIFCDESDVTGTYYSHFYGGVIVGSSQYNRVTDLLNTRKQKLNLYGEVKWSKVSDAYLDKYKDLMHAFFRQIRKGHLRVRIMFSQNAIEPVGLSRDQIAGAYFRLYYQFIKHAFGLAHHHPVGKTPTRLRLYFDEFPATHEAVTRFKGFILGLKDNPQIRRAGFTITLEDIAEFRSHDHVLAQCLDIVLGAMSFRLNNKHKEKPPGKSRRGKRTVAKEKLYKAILSEICAIKPGFNVGISTGLSGGLECRWSAPYLHWRFRPSEWRYREEFTKRGKGAGPT